MFNDLKSKIGEMSDSELEAISLKETLSVSEALGESLVCEPALSPNECSSDVAGDLNPKSNSVSGMTAEFVSKFGVWSNEPGSDRAYLSGFSDEQLNALNPDSNTKYSPALSESTKLPLHEQLLQSFNENGCDPSDDEDEEFTDGDDYSDEDLDDL